MALINTEHWDLMTRDTPFAEGDVLTYLPYPTCAWWSVNDLTPSANVGETLISAGYGNEIGLLRRKSAPAPDWTPLAPHDIMQDGELWVGRTYPEPLPPLDALYKKAKVGGHMQLAIAGGWKGYAASRLLAMYPGTIYRRIGLPVAVVPHQRVPTEGNRRFSQPLPIP